MHDNRHHVEERIDRVLHDRLWPARYAATADVTVHAWAVPGEPVPVGDALAARYEPFAVGDPLGAAWSTTWLHVTGTVPADWAGRPVELVVDLDFSTAMPGFQAEALAYDPAGRPVKGVAPRNAYVPVAAPARGGEPVDLYLETAANPTILRRLPDTGRLDFRPTSAGRPPSPGAPPAYRLTGLHLAVLDEQVWRLVLDVQVLSELMRELDAGQPRRHEILRALERALDDLDPDNLTGTVATARHTLADVLARPAHASAHRVSAVGHAHIDTAWLWPMRETRRKTARTFTNVLALAERYPELVFACSQAQQYAWIKTDQPHLYERIRAAVRAGTWVPVGGMWVESDTNLPGGEALVRQFTYGRRFFRDEFGVEPREVWLPDSFGYTAALPQVARLAGARWFLTQKPSWNRTNRLPHHSFWWEGIDGTRIFTHLPPVDTYNAELTGAELAHTVATYAEKGAATTSLVPFGYGDGGGGPTREMMERARRLADLEGSARVTVESPAAFFAAAEAEYPGAPVWSGEMYLESHRGTYTTQARTKQGNRRSEHLLREAELWAATAAVHDGAAYPYDRLDELWRTVLLHQFHDILPGSSIGWVHREAAQAYERVEAGLQGLIGAAADALGPGPAVLNAAPFDRDEVAVVAAGAEIAGAQDLGDGTVAVPVRVPALGSAPLRGTGLPDSGPVTARSDAGATVLDNGLLRVVVGADGLLSEVVDLRTGRAALAPDGRGNLLQLHPDHPVAFDAWDLDDQYRHRWTDLTDGGPAELVAAGPLLARVRVRRSFGASSVVQTVTLRAGSDTVDLAADVDWRERERVLKAAFGLDVHADRSAAEVQFGHVHRATHENTSWDAARFEICAHRWVHVGETGYGHALVNEATYGHDVSRTTRPGGGTTTTVRLTLLRAPRFPDPDADLGRHRLRYRLLPGADIPAAVRAGYTANLPLRAAGGAPGFTPLVRVDDPRVVVEAVKLADDRSGDVVVRLYEATGGRVATHVVAGFPVAAARVVDLLEEPLTDAALAPVRFTADDPHRIGVELRPFQVATVRFVRAVAS